MTMFRDEIVGIVTDPSMPVCGDAIRAVARRYAEHNKTVRAVLNGTTSFEKLVTPLVEENLRIKFPYKNGACDSEGARLIASEARTRLQDLISLEMSFAIRKRRRASIDLTAPVAIRTSRYVAYAIAMALILAIVQLACYGFFPEMYASCGVARCEVTVAATMLIGGLGTFLYMYVIDDVFMQTRRALAISVLQDARQLDRILAMYHP